MKKNLSTVVFLFIGILAFVSSCVKDTFTEQNAYAEQQKLALLNDSLQKAQALRDAALGILCFLTLLKKSEV